MKIRIQGSKEQCLDGIDKLKKKVAILKISDFQPTQENPQAGVIYIEIGV